MLLIPVDRDEVDELLDSREEHGLEVGIAAHGGEDALPRIGNVSLIRVRPAERVTDSVFPLRSSGDHGPSLDTESRRFHRLPYVDERMTDNEHVASVRSAGNGIRDPRFLRSGDEMVDQNSDSTIWPRPEIVQHALEIVDTLEVFDHNSVDTQIVPPHTLHQLRVVAPFHEYSTGSRHPRAVTFHRDGAGSAPLDHWRFLCKLRVAQDDALSVNQEPAAQCEYATATPSIIKFDVRRVDPHDRAAEL